MPDEIIPDARFLDLLKKHGVVETARLLKRRYPAVRDAAIKAGFKIQHGRRRLSSMAGRDEEIRRLRAKGRSLDEIGKKFSISRERVRQVLHLTGGDPRFPDPDAKTMARIRLERADGQPLKVLASRFQVTRRQLQTLLRQTGGDPYDGP